MKAVNQQLFHLSLNHSDHDAAQLLRTPISKLG